MSLEEVHGAVAFYLANQNDVHLYLERQKSLWKEQRDRAEQTSSPVVARLRAMNKTPDRTTP
jgi:hypothetical protein